MICKHAKKTGKPCANGYSREIECPHSKTKCLRDCGPGCNHYAGDYTAAAYGGGGTSTGRKRGCCGSY